MRIRLESTTDVALFLEACSRYSNEVLLYSCIGGKPIDVATEGEKLLKLRVPKSYDAYVRATGKDTITNFRRDIALWEDWS